MLRISVLAALLASAASGQSLLAPLETWNVERALKAGMVSMAGFGAAPGGVVVGVTVIHSPVTAFALVREDEAVRLPLLLPRAQQLRALRGRWAITVSQNQDDPKTWLLTLHDLESGESKVLQTVSGFASAALSDHRAAVLDAAPVGPVLRIYRLAGGWMETESRIQLHPFDVFPSFAAEDRLLLVGRSDYRVTPLVLGDTSGAIREEPTYELSGPEVTDARRKSSPSFGLGKVSSSPGSAKRVNTHAHLTTQGGRDLFLLTPLRPADGLRLVEFDREGQEEAVHLLRLPRGTDLKEFRLFANPWLPPIAAEGGEIRLYARDGRIFRYTRP